MRSRYWVANSGNAALQLFMDYGLIGLLLFYTFLVTILWRTRYAALSIHPPDQFRAWRRLSAVRSACAHDDGARRLVHRKRAGNRSSLQAQMGTWLDGRSTFRARESLISVPIACVTLHRKDVTSDRGDLPGSTDAQML